MRDLYTVESALEEARKYRTIKQFSKENIAAYKFLLNKHRTVWIVFKTELARSDPSRALLLNRVKKVSKWTEESVLSTAAECESMTHFIRSYIGAWCAAHRMGIADKVRRLINENQK